MRERSELVDKGNPKVSVRKQCKLLAVARSSADYQPVGESQEDLEFKRILDEIYLADPCLGSRRLVTLLERDYDRRVNRKRLRRLRREMGPGGDLVPAAHEHAGRHSPEVSVFAAETEDRTFRSRVVR
jgi:hypothetical protein